MARQVVSKRGSQASPRRSTRPGPAAGRAAAAPVAALRPAAVEAAQDDTTRQGRHGARGAGAGKADSLRERLHEVLELKGHAVEELRGVGKGGPALRAQVTTFRDFTDPYLVDLCELPEGRALGSEEWKRFEGRHARSGIARGVLVTNGAVSPAVGQRAGRDPNLAVFTFDELLVDLIDFGPYLENVISSWESDPLHSGEIIIPAQGSLEAAGGERFALDSYVDEWLADPERDPLFLLGRYGSGKTTFAKRLCARLARAYRDDPVHHRVPILLPLREYANLSDMDELIVGRIAELAPEQAPPSRKAFRLLLEADRFCLVLDGLDELIRRLDPGYVLKNFDKICTLIGPRTKAMITARQGYLGTPEDEDQILGIRGPMLEPHAAAPVRKFQRLYLEPVDRADIDWYIERRYPDRSEHYKMVIETRSELLELAHTPLLLELMLRSLPLLEGKLYVNPAVVMTAFVNSWAELGRSRRPVLTSAEDAIFFATELAWQMHWGGVFKVHFTEISHKIRLRFRERTIGIEEPDPFRIDMRDCPFLSVDREGNYAFVQNAFLDFLAALAYMRYLVEHGTAPVDHRRTNPDMQRFVRDLATMDERYLQAYYRLLDELKLRDDPTQWLFYRDLLPHKEKIRIYDSERQRIRELVAQAPEPPPEGMVYVPGGDVIFGSFEHRDESPVRRVRLEPYYVDQHPVTNAQYLKFLEETGHQRPLWTIEAPEAWVDGRPPAGTEQLPVTQVSFEDAVAYATWAGKRLPTEQEWECAARGYEGRRYPWGDEFDALKVNGTEGDTGGRLEPVGRRPEGVSPFACHDMAGNIWEWTNSRFDKFHALKILRGGSYRADRDALRCANRLFWDPDFPKPDIGFRCVASAPPREDPVVPPKDR